MVTLSMTIDGKPVAGTDTFEVTNPSTGKTAGYAPKATLADLDAVVAAAEVAFKTWSLKPDADLAEICGAVTAKIPEHAEELAKLLTLEQGKPLNGLGSRWEMGGAAAWAGYTSGRSLPMKTLLDNNKGPVEMFRKSIGFVGSITPWNFPAMIAIWHIMPALRTGKTVVIKPSPMTPLATLRMVEIMNEVLPAGVLNIVTSDDTGDNIGAAMPTRSAVRSSRLRRKPGCHITRISTVRTKRASGSTRPPPMEARGGTGHSIFLNPAAPDVKSGLLEALATGADTMLINLPAGLGIAVLKAAEEQDLRDAYKRIAPSPLDDLSVPAALSDYWDGVIYVNAELAPFNDGGPDNENWIKVMDGFAQPDDPRDTFAQSGFLSARFFVDTLLGMDPADVGDRAKVTEAITAISGYTSDLLCGPYYVGADDFHMPNHAGHMVLIKDGGFEVVRNCYEYDSANFVRAKAS